MRREQYLTAASYISSRAFPSKLLSMSEAGRDTETNAVQTSEEEESHPVLIPGMDIFNRESRYLPEAVSCILTPQTQEGNQ